jgi:hypothetical protein
MAHVRAPCSARGHQVQAIDAGSLPVWKIRMLYDGECPLCMKEVNFLQQRDAGAGAIDFVDIAASGYSPSQNAGLEYETVMGEIHALLPDGTIIVKVRSGVFTYDLSGCKVCSADTSSG